MRCPSHLDIGVMMLPQTNTHSQKGVVKIFISTFRNEYIQAMLYSHECIKIEESWSY